jgi:hypothetical protein
MDWWIQQQFALARDSAVVVRETLESRGFAWLKGERPRLELLLARSDISFGGPNADRYNHLLRASHTFRRLLSLLVDRRDAGPSPEDTLARKSGCADPGRLREYLRVLAEQQFAVYTGDGWALAPDVAAKQFGPTFEWLVADAFRQHLHWSAAQGVSLEDCEDNDYDVVAVHGADIIVVECKATTAIEDRELHAFAERHRFLRPMVSILLVDSKNTVAPEATRLDRCGKIGGFQTCKIDPKGGLFLLIPAECSETSLYVANTAAGRDGITRALQACIRNHRGPRADAAIWDG